RSSPPLRHRARSLVEPRRLRSSRRSGTTRPRPPQRPVNSPTGLTVVFCARATGTPAGRPRLVASGRWPLRIAPKEGEHGRRRNLLGVGGRRGRFFGKLF